jgi:ferric-dicitrate binding protein FerR (iron transport regulator)
MTETNERPTPDDEAQLARVLRRAARVPEIPAERRAAAFERVHAEWRTATERSARRWTPLRAGLAASVAATLVAVTLLSGRLAGPAGADVAVALAANGTELSVGRSGWLDRWRAPVGTLQSGAVLQTADVLTTGASSAALLRVGPVLTLRVAPESQLRFDSADRVTLLRGQLYVDSGARSGIATALTVATALGEVQHVGTRYLVRAGSGSLEVAVREGRVRLSGFEAATRAEAAAGQRLRLGAGGRSIERGALAADDSAYGWLAAIPTPIDIEGRTLGAFLDWYSAETGRAVVLGQGDAASTLRDVRLSGRVAGLSPDQALDTVAAVADLTISRDESGVRIGGAAR